MITRVYITHVVKNLSQFMQNPGQVYMDATLKILGYLKSDRRRGVHYRSGNTLNIIGHCDAEWTI